ncbi:MAG: glycosyltransferase [Verrucomicrobia bacterium]|nr:glycosyltransferase [Verrucomicrobiota bacterium]
MAPDLASAASEGDARKTLYFVANGVFSASMAGGDVNFMRMAEGCARAGYQVIFIGGPALELQLQRCGLAFPVLRVGGPLVGFNSPDTLTRQMQLFWDYARRAWEACRLVRRLPRESLMYAVTSEWQDVFPAIYSRSGRKFLMLHMLCPTLREVFTSTRADIAQSRLAALHYWLGQNLPLRLFRRCRSHHVFYQSPQFVPRLLAHGYDVRNLSHVPGGIDVTVADTVPPQPLAYDVVWIGRYHRQKGIEDLLATLANAAKQLPDFRAIIIGDVEERLRPLVQARGLDAHVHFAGFVTGIEKFRLFKRARVFLMPSHYESYGFVIGEALACGLPVVAYDLQAYRPIFGDLLTYVSAFDLRAFEARALALIRDARAGMVILDEAALVKFTKAVAWENAQAAFVQGVSR